MHHDSQAPSHMKTASQQPSTRSSITSQNSHSIRTCHHVASHSPLNDSKKWCRHEPPFQNPARRSLRDPKPETTKSSRLSSLKTSTTPPHSSPAAASARSRLTLAVLKNSKRSRTPTNITHNSLPLKLHRHQSPAPHITQPHSHNTPPSSNKISNRITTISNNRTTITINIKQRPALATFSRPRQAFDRWLKAKKMMASTDPNFTRKIFTETKPRLPKSLQHLHETLLATITFTRHPLH